MKVLYKVSSKQNDRRATQGQCTEPLVYFVIIVYSTYVCFTGIDLINKHDM